jgi:F-type H+-transporting ATPase subunit c
METELIEVARLIAKSICTLSMGASAIGEGYLLGKGLEAIGRNPDVDGSIFSKMIISAAIAESTAIYALVGFFVL